MHAHLTLHWVCGLGSPCVAAGGAEVACPQAAAGDAARASTPPSAKCRGDAPALAAEAESPGVAAVRSGEAAADDVPLLLSPSSAATAPLLSPSSGAAVFLRSQSSRPSSNLNCRSFSSSCSCRLSASGPELPQSWPHLTAGFSQSSQGANVTCTERKDVRASLCASVCSRARENACACERVRVRGRVRGRVRVRVRGRTTTRRSLCAIKNTQACVN